MNFTKGTQTNSSVDPPHFQLTNNQLGDQASILPRHELYESNSHASSRPSGAPNDRRLSSTTDMDSVDPPRSSSSFLTRRPLEVLPPRGPHEFLSLGAPHETPWEPKVISVKDLEVSVSSLSVAPRAIHFSPSDLERYLNEATTGSAETQYILGMMFKNGTEDVSQDYRQAEEWFLMAAQQGHSDARYELAHMSETGFPPSYPSTISQNQRFHLYNSRPPAGLLPGYSESMEEQSKTTGQEAKGSKEVGYASTRLQHRLAAAEKGSLTSQYLVGMMYEEGKEVAQDYTEAVRWYLRAAMQGYTSAQCRMADLYEEGKGVPKDFSKSIRWYKKAAFAGDEDAMVTLGLIYENGKGTSKDHTKARAWFLKAAKQGYPRAQVRMALLYEDGKGPPQIVSEVETVVWYKEAADQGDDFAQYRLGAIFEEGKGVPPDTQKAKEWYTKAADQGNVQARICLASLQARTVIAPVKKKGSLGRSLGFVGAKSK